MAMQKPHVFLFYGETRQFVAFSFILKMKNIPLCSFLRVQSAQYERWEAWTRQGRLWCRPRWRREASTTATPSEFPKPSSSSSSLRCRRTRLLHWRPIPRDIYFRWSKFSFTFFLQNFHFRFCTGQYLFSRSTSKVLKPMKSSQLTSLFANSGSSESCWQEINWILNFSKLRQMKTFRLPSVEREGNRYKQQKKEFGACLLFRVLYNVSFSGWFTTVTSALWTFAQLRTLIQTQRFLWASQPRVQQVFLWVFRPSMYILIFLIKVAQYIYLNQISQSGKIIQVLNQVTSQFQFPAQVTIRVLIKGKNADWQRGENER